MSVAEARAQFQVNVVELVLTDDRLRHDDVDALAATVCGDSPGKRGVDIVLAGVSLDLQTQVAGIGNSFTEPHYQETVVIQVRRLASSWPGGK